MFRLRGFMKNVQVDIATMKDFVATLFANGKTPSEAFGITHEQLSELERQNPAIVTKMDCEENRRVCY